MNQNNDGILHCRILQLQPWGTCPMAFAVPLHCWLFSNDTLLTHLATLSMCWPCSTLPTADCQLTTWPKRQPTCWWDQILYLQWHFCATMSSFPEIEKYIPWSILSPSFYWLNATEWSLCIIVVIFCHSIKEQRLAAAWSLRHMFIKISSQREGEFSVHIRYSWSL